MGPTLTLEANPEDVVQHAFEKLALKLDTIDNPAGWLRTVAKKRVALTQAELKNVSALDIGQCATDGEFSARWSSIARAATLDDTVAVREIARTIKRLPNRRRQVVYLRLIAGMPAAEVAALLGMAINTVGVHVHRGTRALREQLSEQAEINRIKSANLILDRMLAPVARRTGVPALRSREWIWCPCQPDPPSLRDRSPNVFGLLTDAVNGRARSDSDGRTAAVAMATEPRRVSTRTRPSTSWNGLGNRGDDRIGDSVGESNPWMRLDDLRRRWRAAG